MEVFRDIAQAEANVHQMPVEEIHFHEVGATDSIIDIMSFFILWETLDIDMVYSTAVTEGSGTITVAHGVMPVPSTCRDAIKTPNCHSILTRL